MEVEMEDASGEKILLLASPKGMQKALPNITRERVHEEILRLRRELAHDMEECAIKYPRASGKTLGFIITE